MTKKNKKKQRKPTGIPSQIDRISLDKQLIAEIKLCLELGISEDQIKKRYHVTPAQIDYSRKNGKSLDTLHADTTVNIRRKY